MSKAVNWQELDRQYAINSVYEEEITKLLEYCGVGFTCVSKRKIVNNYLL